MMKSGLPDFEDDYSPEAHIENYFKAVENVSSSDSTQRLSHRASKFSSRAIDGSRHKLSLDPRPIQANLYTLYEARVESELRFCDPRHLQIVIAKFPGFKYGSQTWAKHEVEMAERARVYANKYNEVIKGNASLDSLLLSSGTGNQQREGPIKFLLPQISFLDAVSCWDKSRRTCEFFVFEDKLKKFRTFISIDGKLKQESKQPFCLSCLYRIKDKKKKSLKKLTSKANNDKDSWDEGWKQDVVDHRVGGIPFDLEDVLEKPPAYCYIYPDNPPPYNEIDIKGSFETSPNYQSHPYKSNYKGQPEIFEKEMVIGPEKCPHRHRMTLVLNQNEASDEVLHPLLHAYIHMSFYSCKGQHIISDLRGSHNVQDNSYILTTPTFHSVNQTFGNRDQGVSGIRRVMENHKCSRLCCHLPSMESILSRCLMKAHEDKIGKMIWQQNYHFD